MNQPSAYIILRVSESHWAQDDTLRTEPFQKTSFKVHPLQLERFVDVCGKLGFMFRYLQCSVGCFRSKMLCSIDRSGDYWAKSLHGTID